MSEQVPEGWVNITLREIAQNYKGSIVDGPFGSNLKISDYVKSGVPVLQGKNVTNDVFFWSDVRYVSNQKADEIRRSSVRVGDILMVKIGSVGYSAIVDDLKGYDYAIIPANLLKISLDDNKASTEYVHQYLISPEGKKRIIDSASSTAQPALSLGIVKNFKINLPPLPEQQKIASILTSVDEVIERTQSQINKLQDLKKATMNELLTRGIGHKEFKDSPVGRIPKSWEVCELKETNIKVLDGDRGKEYPKEHQFYNNGYCLFLSAKNVTSGGFKFEETQFVTKEKDEKLRKGRLVREDIVITTRGTVGNMAIFDNSVPYDVIRINSGMAIIRVDDSSINREYLFNYLNSQIVISQVEFLTFGSAQPQLTIGIINSLNLVIPPLDEQLKLNKMFSSLNKTIKETQRKFIHIKSLKISLMQDLLSGRVRVQVN